MNEFTICLLQALWILVPLALLFLLGRFLSASGSKRPLSGNTLFSASCGMRVGRIGVSFPLGEITVFSDRIHLKYVKEEEISIGSIDNIKLRGFFGMSSLSFEYRKRGKIPVLIQGCNCKQLHNVLLSIQQSGKINNSGDAHPKASVRE